MLSHEQLHSQETSRRVSELEDEVATLKRDLETQWSANHFAHCCYHAHDPNADCRWPRPVSLDARPLT